MTEGAIRFFEPLVRKTDLVLEYGGGWSSLWWAERAGSTLTVEASPEWAPTLLQEFARRPDLLGRWSMRFVPCEWHYKASVSKPYWRKHQGHMTADIAARLEADYLDIPCNPDVIVIDGSIRPQCVNYVDRLLRTTSRLSRTRMIIVDNMETMSRHTVGKFPDFIQHDFAETDLKKIPPHQRGQWMTSVWVSTSAVSRLEA